MKKLLGTAAAAALVIGFMPAAMSQSASDDGAASVQILEPIGITAGQALTFGQVAAGTSAGTVTCDTAGNVSSTNVTQVGGCQQGIFTVTGEDSSSFSIAIPTGDITLTSGANSLTVNTFVSDPAGSGTIASGGTTINVGATLQVPTTAVAGNYTGTYTVTVDYN